MLNIASIVEYFWTKNHHIQNYIIFQNFVRTSPGPPNFHPIEVLGRVSEKQLKVGENLKFLM